MLIFKGLLYFVVTLFTATFFFASINSSLIAQEPDEAAFKDVENKAHILKEKGVNEYNINHFDKALLFFGEALVLYKGTNDSTGMSACYNNAGLACKELGRFEEALTLFQEALKIDMAINDTQGLAAVYNNIGELYHLQYRYLNALHYYMLSLKLEVADSNTVGIGDCYLNMGALLEENAYYHEAMGFYKKAMICYVQADATWQSAKCLNNMGVASTRLNEFYKAKDYFEASLQIKNLYGDVQGSITTWLNLGNLSVLLGDSMQAWSYFSNALLADLSEEELLDAIPNYNDNKSVNTDDLFFYRMALYVENGYGFLVPQTLFYKGYMLYCSGAYEEASAYFTNSLELASFYEITPLVKDNLYYLYLSYSEMSHFEKSSYYAGEYMALSDSLHAAGLLDFLNLGGIMPEEKSENKFQPAKTSEKNKSQGLPVPVLIGLILVAVAVIGWRLRSR